MHENPFIALNNPLFDPSIFMFILFYRHFAIFVDNMKDVIHFPYKKLKTHLLTKKRLK
jgi:hypothetical protein